MRLPVSDVAVTEIVDAQDDGKLRFASPPALPAAATIARNPVADRSDARNASSSALHGSLPMPPRLRFTTCAGVGLFGTPGTGKPAAHAIASNTSENSPPHLPSARTGRMRAPQSTPASAKPLFPFAATMPATEVPCQLESSLSQPGNRPLSMSSCEIQSPGSVGSGSRPSPSFAVSTSLTKS